ncbi:hypothetical protein FYF81_20130 [Vibrio vulnificus]|nr:hypothetical protein [Vibrio vulnificus]
MPIRNWRQAFNRFVIVLKTDSLNICDSESYTELQSQEKSPRCYKQFEYLGDSSCRKGVNDNVPPFFVSK